jgi:tRNA pseudouridine38-40 synthase
MKNIKLILEYDGTNYCGWQWQPGQKTLQGALEEAVRKTSGEEVRVTASGRTDAGVHAWGQVVNFMTGAGLDCNSWRGALNHHLSHDIRVLEAAEAAPDFNARHSAKGKTYEYIVINRYIPCALKRGYTWHVGVPLDVEAMRDAAKGLIGEHDFTSFRAADCAAKSPVRTVWKLDLTQKGEAIKFSLGASAFLRHMVRNIVGTLVEVGRGRMHQEDVPAILDARDRTKAGPTAPPQGLYLVKVNY